MLLIPGFPAGDGFEFDLKYAFHTETIGTEAGYEARYADYSCPQRELTFTLGSSDQFAFSQLNSILLAGATICIVPLWQLRESLPYGITAGIDDQVLMPDVTEYKVNDYVYLTRATQVSLHEVHQLTQVAGTTLYLDSAVTRDYTPVPTSGAWPVTDACGYIMPCISGVVDHDAVEFWGGRPCFLAKLKINGGAWQGADTPALSDYFGQPMAAQYSAPKIVKEVLGITNGVYQLRAIESTNRLTFELTWEFHDTTWRTLRDLFFAAEGSTNQFYMPTWLFEMEITRGSDSGSTSIFLPDGYQYLWERFPRLMIKPIRTNTTPTVAVVTAYIGNGEFTCGALARETLLHDRVCFTPLVRFETDDLTFNFKDINCCQAKAAFIEVLVES